MAIDTTSLKTKLTSQTSKWAAALGPAMKRMGRFLGRVFKPGGWRYLRPTRAQEQPEHDEAEVEKRKAA